MYNNNTMDELSSEDNNSDDEKDTDTEEVLLSRLSAPKTLEELQNSNYWIADSGASMHSTPYTMGLYDCRDLTTAITVASGDVTQNVKVGRLKGQIKSKAGQLGPTITLTNVSSIPTGKYSLWSISKMLQSGWNMTGNKHSISLNKGEVSIIFDIVVPTANGRVYCLFFERTCDSTTILVNLSKPSTNWSISTLHYQLGHLNEKSVREVAKSLGYTLKSGTIPVCEA